MFYKFTDFDNCILFINLNRISHIYSDDDDSTLFHVVLVDDLEEDIEILITKEEFDVFVRFINYDYRIKKVA